jgi:hypothetical protein
MTLTAPNPVATEVVDPITADRDDRSRRTAKVERLNTASNRRVIDPDVDVVGQVGDGEVLPRHLLSITDLDLDLTDEQWRTLSREEMASILDAGVRFESMLMANFGRSLAYRRDLTDPRVTYMLHEVGEETRHSRLFIRVLTQLEPTAVNPFVNRFYAMIDRRLTAWAIRHDALFMTMVLFGEEGPDLLQRLAVEDDDTDPFVRDVNRYHRAEEARHLAYGRTVLAELFAEASFVERFVIRHLGPLAGAGIFDTLVHPGVYATVGLPTWKTWNAARKSPTRSELRRQVLAPVCVALVKAGAVRGGRPTRAWRKAITPA